MCPRRARRRDDTPRPLRVEGDVATEHAADGDWVVRPISAEAAVKTYRCPGCDQEIPPAVPHVVAWRVGEEELRRHWHRPCWGARLRRGLQRRR
ncbi:MAG TPA: hypothetical protein VFT62_10020 [Mycobacteriales bacterium]|nr:hypothetical protein [Mycobacteriales bacterium]